MIVEIPAPKEILGKWAITTVYGTHGSYEIFATLAAFDTEKMARDYMKNDNKYASPYHDVMKIDTNYPVMQIEISIHSK